MMGTATAAQPSGSSEERPPLEPDLDLACDFALRWAPETFPFITIASIFPGGVPRAHTWHAEQDQPHLRLASWAGKHGWPISDAWALIITNRETFCDRNDQKKALRRDYVLRTLSLAHAKTGAAAAPSSPIPENNEWPEPGRIGSGIPDAPVFPVDALPEVLRDWAVDQADRMQAPIDFLAIPGLVTLCGCIGKVPTLRPKRFDDWAERPCLWAVLIDDPGSMKTVTLKAATDPLRAVEKKKMADWQSVHDEWKARQRERALREAAHEKQLKKMLDRDPAAELPARPALDDDPEPLPPRMIAADATIESWPT